MKQKTGLGTSVGSAAGDAKSNLSPTENAATPGETLSDSGKVKPFNLERFKRRDGLTKVEGVRRVTTISIGKPLKTEWVRTRDGWSMGPVATITIPEDRETYLVTDDVADSLDRHLYDDVELHAAVTTSGRIFLWQLKITDRASGWSQSAAHALALSKQTWVQVAAQMTAGEYFVETPVGTLAEPLWPEGLTFERIVELAAQERTIDSIHHPVIRRLRGDF